MSCASKMPSMLVQSDAGATWMGDGALLAGGTVRFGAAGHD